MIIFKM